MPYPACAGSAAISELCDAWHGKGRSPRDHAAPSIVHRSSRARGRRLRARARLAHTHARARSGLAAVHASARASRRSTRRPARSAHRSSHVVAAARLLKRAAPPCCTVRAQTEARPGIAPIALSGERRRIALGADGATTRNRSVPDRTALAALPNARRGSRRLKAGRARGADLRYRMRWAWATSATRPGKRADLVILDRATLAQRMVGQGEDVVSRVV